MKPAGKAADLQPTIRSTEYRCYIKEILPICNSGRENPIVDIFLRPPDTPRSDGT